jgi:TM2 domain-containing membrane protein YozV
MDRNDSQLVLHDIPILLWFLGLIFAGFGAFMFFQSGQASAWALVFVAIGLGALLFSSALTITADRITRTLKLEYRSALRHTIKQVSFDEIAGIDVERSFSRNIATYRVIVMRKDGQVIRLRSTSSSGSGRKERQASQLRDFLGLQGFDTSTAGLFYAANQVHVGEIHDTNGVRWQIQPPAMSAFQGTRWHSPDLTTPGVFLFVAQKAEGQATSGLLASLGSMMFKQALSMHGFRADDTPGLEQAGPLAPLDPVLEPHFMAFTNDPASARKTLNPRAVAPLADWAGRYPLKQFQRGSRFSQLVILFSPNGVYLNTLNLLRPDQVNELTALGVALVKSQSSSRESVSSSF